MRIPYTQLNFQHNPSILEIHNFPVSQGQSKLSYQTVLQRGVGNQYCYVVCMGGLTSIRLVCENLCKVKLGPLLNQGEQTHNHASILSIYIESGSDKVSKENATPPCVPFIANYKHLRSSKFFGALTYFFGVRAHA